MKIAMKNTLENVLVWALGKLNITRLKQLTVDEDRIVVGYSRFLPDDGQWHQVGLTTLFWIKRGTDGVRQDDFAHVTLFMDNQEAARWHLDHNAPQS